MHNNRKLAIAAWCLYDWACASYSIIVVTFIFSTYYTTRIAADQITGTYQWANATSIAGIIIAIASPVVGSIADYRGYHKYWLFGFTAIAIIFSALLWFAYPSVDYIYYTLTCVIISTIAYEVAQVFYNSFLPTLAPKQYLGRISGIGWGSGYIGGIIALTIALFFFVRSHFSFLDTATAAQIRICGPFVAIWYGLFALPFFFFVPKLTSASLPIAKAISAGMKELANTLRQLPHEKDISLYLLSHMIYTDGLNTLFAFGGIYAAGTYGLSFEEVLVFGITMNITAGIGAIALGWMDDFFGSKQTVVISLIFLTILGVPLLLLHDKYMFWCVALLLCLFVGPVQSASRSMMVRLIASKSAHAEMFGLYALSGKITAFIGPWILGVVTLQFSSQRVGMGTVLVFFALGALSLLPVRVPDNAINLADEAL